MFKVEKKKLMFTKREDGVSQQNKPYIILKLMDLDCGETTPCVYRGDVGKLDKMELKKGEFYIFDLYIQIKGKYGNAYVTDIDSSGLVNKKVS